MLCGCRLKAGKETLGSRIVIDVVRMPARSRQGDIERTLSNVVTRKPAADSQELSRRRKESRRQIIQEHRQEEIENQNDDERGHEGLGGRSTDSLRPGPAVISSMTTDQGDDRAKENRLDQSGKNIPGSNEF